MFESRENTTVKAVILRPADSISDVINKVGMWDKISNTSRADLSLLFIGTERTGIEAVCTQTLPVLTLPMFVACLEFAK